jgi:uncharacterized repeat protein (TIGR01451 family)
MKLNAAVRRVWSPMWRPRRDARTTGYSHEGGVATSYPAFGAFRSRAKAALASIWLFAACLIGPAVSVAQVTPPGTMIRNIGNVQYAVGAQARTANSNEVALAVDPLPSRASIQLARFESSSVSTFTAGPTQCRAGNTFVPLAAPAPQGTGQLDPLTPIPMQDTAIAHAGDPIFVRVIDADRNRDAALIETVDVRVTVPSTGDSEVLRLSETGPDTGVFVGYIATITGAAANDCALAVERNDVLDATYVDPTDSSDAAQAEALVDPYGLVFDSQTGAAVNGARVRLIDVNTGLAATVFGDDGVSRYPSEMVTGQPVTDQGGTQYSMPAGVFRFPLVAPGSYRLEVLPPGSHAFPSQRTIADLQTLPDAPFRLQPGSFGNSFVVTAAPGVGVDVPLDPAGDTLILRKTAGQQIATAGDFVQYTLTLENASQTGVFNAVQIVDRLPAGARYRPGSLRLDGVRVPDPVVSPDGSGFTYTHPSIPAGATLTLRYVVEYTIAMRGMRDALNTAQAIAPGNVRSNEARALVRMNEELFSQKGFIVGRVFEGTCDADGRKADGVAGVRVYLEDGRYGVTDEQGRFHFEGLDPGTHTVQLDKLTLPEYLELAPCADRMGHAGRDYSQFAELRGGTLWRADFVLRQKAPPKGDLTFEFNSALLEDPKREGLAAHEAVVHVGGVSSGNTRAMIMLPEGFEYLPGSATVDGAKVTDARDQVEGVGDAVVAADEGAVIARLGELPPGSVRTFRFRTRSTPAAGGELKVRALVMFDSPAKSGLRTAPVEATLARGAAIYGRSQFTFTPRFDVLRTELLPSDERALRSLIDSWRGAREISIRAVGHADSQPISGRNRKVFADNYALSEARGRTVAEYLAAALNVPAARVHVEGHGSDEPLKPGKDAASLAANRRVDIVIEGSRFEANAPLELRNAGGEAPKIDTVGVVLRGPGRAVQNVRRVVKPEQQLGGAPIDIETLSPGIQWLTPEADATPPIAAIKIAIQHEPGQKVELTNNGRSVDVLNFDGASVNEANTVALSRWRGVDLVNGDNVFAARVLAANGAVVWKAERTVHYGGGPVRAELDKGASKLVADGRARPVIALRMFDSYGKPARAGTIASFSVDSPYRSWWEVDQLNDNQILSNGPREPQVEVRENGLALIELEPTTTTGNAVIRLRFNERQSDEFKVWLAPAARDWILVGIAEGTAAYNSISGNMETAGAADREEGFEEQGRVAFFAKGRIKGDFLLTMAYDSAREKKDARDRLKGVIEPDRYYLLYGDGTEQRFEAATQNKLYLKIERRQFVALFGDFDTGFTVTELTRYSRSLSGLRSDFAGEHVSVSGFAARTDTGLVQDELRGDGTSGLYRLSRAPIVIGSDKLRIEIRDRFEITRVVESSELSRFLDYDLDYERGTIFFKEPVPSRDANLNPVFIVADYEVRTGGDDETAAGIRVATRLAADKIELGASAVHEGAQAGDTRVVGGDLTWRVSDATKVRAEIAQSQSDDPLKADSSLAWLVEGRHVSERLEARAWAREAETGFGVGQQLTADTGARSGGVDARYKLNDTFTVAGEVQHQQMLASEAKRLLASADVRMQKQGYSVGAGLRHVADDDASGDERVSDQAFVTASVDVWDGRMTLRGSSDASLGGKDASVDYPARSILGVDYRLSGDTTLFAEYEHGDGDQLDTDMMRFGVRTRPWERTQVRSAINTQNSEYGPRTFANFGLTQGFTWRERWAFDVGIDQTNTLRGPDLEPVNPNAPLASGSMTEDFFAAFVGASYRKELWQMTSRLEHRNSDNEERWSSTTGWYREPVEGHAMSVSLQAFDSTQQLAESTEAVGRFAWAFRPDSSDWIVFDRFELKHDERGDALNSFESSRLVNNLHANWQLNPDLQLGLQYGVRYVSSTFEGEKYAGVSDIAGFDLRRQLTRRFDLGVHAALLHSWESDVMDHSTGVDVGITLMKNMWISLGYNFEGFRDDDFSGSRHTAQGPYLKIRIKADQDTFKDLNLDSLRPSR